MHLSSQAAADELNRRGMAANNGTRRRPIVSSVTSAHDPPGLQNFGVKLFAPGRGPPPSHTICEFLNPLSASA
jgi:hypothetical protein